MGKFLYLLARLQGARAILEIGTLGGYSTTWLARGLSRDGRLATLESNPRHAEVARANIARAGLADRVRLHEGRAIDSLPLITGPFDLISSMPTSRRARTISNRRCGLRAAAA